MTELSPEVREKVKEAVFSYPDLWKHQGTSGYIAAYTILVRETGNRTASNYGRAGAGCHYGFSSISDNQIAINAHLPQFHGKHPDYVKWACRESPFAHGVINKDEDDEILNHAAALDGLLIGKGGCLWLGKALRYTVEDRFRLPFWYQLREAGLDGLQAFIGCSILTSAGAPQYGNTHNSLVSYGSPESLRKIYDELKALKKNDTTSAARAGDWGAGRNGWGSLSSKTVKKSDGWGGFTEVKVPCDASEFAAKLKEIFEGDPKNVG